MQNHPHDTVLSSGLRFMIEFFLYSVAVVAPWFVWSQSLAAAAAIVVLATVVTGVARTRWLLRGAPL